MIEKYIKLPKKKSIHFIQKFFETKIGKDFVNLSKIIDPTEESNNLLSQQSIYRPNLNDLYRLYNLIILNKRTQLLEFGTGWSSLIMAKALKYNQIKYQTKIKNLRRANPFELHVVDCKKKYINISKERIKKFKEEKLKIKFIYSKCCVTLYNNQIANEYLKLPLINPDFIYLDGPDQKDITGNINGINLKHNDFMPMNSDILKMEPFLLPGTIIVTDGRGANSQFLLNNFKRNWVYKFDDFYDQHLFYLHENSIGHINKKLLNFYKEK